MSDNKKTTEVAADVVVLDKDGEVVENQYVVV